MGKRYFCDYCAKTMNCSPAIVKKHNQGFIHQKLVQEHYHQYKGPEEILHEVSDKRPCLRFFNGECQFGGVCRFSHYTEEQITALKEQVAAKSAIKHDFNQPLFEDLYQKLQSEKTKSNTNDCTVLYDGNGVMHTLPWTYNERFEMLDLPPSLKKIELNDFANIELNMWG